ncbi:MAG: trypsin-like peptidase domain-containing protein [Eubacteriales bacterium]
MSKKALSIALIFVLCLLCACVPLALHERAESAYDIAVRHGFIGSEQEWLDSLAAPRLSAEELYQTALAHGYAGDIHAFLSEYFQLDAQEVKHLLAEDLLQQASAYIGRALLASVSLHVSFPLRADENGGGGTGSSVGSGVIYRLDGGAGDAYLLTNYHVVYHADATTPNRISDHIEAFLYGMEHERYALRAEYVGGSQTYDIALLKVSGSDLLKKSAAMAAVVADSDLVAVGDTIVALGNAEGEGISATQGVVNVDSERVSMTAADEVSTVTHRLMRVDAALNHGNSGGGVFDSRGQLVGIVNAKMVDEATENVGYVIPANVAVAVADNLIDHCEGQSGEKVRRCMLGVTVTVSHSFAGYDSPGGRVRITEQVAVSEVSPHAPAYGKLRVGDIIRSLTLNGQSVPISRSYQLHDRLLSCRAGDTVTLEVLRYGEPLTLSFTFTEADLVTVE